jgi:adenylate cyclase
MFGGLAGLNRVLGELRRRRVLRLAGVYILGAWLILQVADVLLEIVAAPEGSLRVIAIVLVLGFPLAVVIAWIYDLTPSGVVRTSKADDPEAKALSWSWPWVGLGTFLAIAGLLGFVLSRDDPSIQGPPGLSIAVLPFADLSPGGDNRYFSDGLAEALMDSLSSVPGLQVAARTSSFAFRDPGRDVREVAKSLEVGSLVEGSVRKSGNQLRISTRLVDGRSGRNLWSATFDASTEDVFAVQDTISRGIAEALQIRLLGSETLVPATSIDATAFDEYLRGRAELRGVGTPESMARALEHFRRALELEPGFALAMAGSCRAYWGKYGWTRDTDLADQAIQACGDAEREEAPRAEVQVALAGLYLGMGQTDRSRDLLERAVEIWPNDAEVHASLGALLGKVGDFEAARAHVLRAIELDPAYWRYHLIFATVLAQQGLFDEAIARTNRAIRLQPNASTPYFTLGGIYFLQGDELKAADAYRESIARYPDPRAYSNAGTFYFYAGEFAQAEEMYRQAVALTPADFRFHAFLGESIELQNDPSRTDARDHFEEAIRLAYDQLTINPEDHETRSAVANYLAQAGRRTEALNELRRLTTLVQPGMIISRNIAMTYLYLEEYEEAVRFFSEAVASGLPVVQLQRDPRLAVLAERIEFQALLSANRSTE